MIRQIGASVSQRRTEKEIDAKKSRLVKKKKRRLWQKKDGVTVSALQGGEIDGKSPFYWH